MKKKCHICNQGKATRFCTAVNDEICSFCCGSKRQKGIECFPSCEHLKQGEKYQLSKQISKEVNSSFKTEAEDIFQNEADAIRFVAPIEKLLVKNFYNKNMNPYWIYAENKSNKYPEHTEYGGKWLIFVSTYAVDKIWMKIKKATEEGILGGSSKVATAKTNPGFPNSRVRVICVYAYDWRDEKDVKRVREELRKIGITRKIAYKSDEDTDRGVYSTNGHNMISKY